MASVLALLLVPLGACGSGGAPTASAMTGEELVQTANAICAESDTRIDALFAPITTGGTPTDEQFQTVHTGLVAEARNVTAKLGALSAPPEMAADYQAFVTAMTSATDKVEAEGLAFFDDPEDPFAEASRLAAVVGLDACAS